MKIIKTISEITQFLQQVKQQSIGFVPTMGALHAGHLSLIQMSKTKTDITICSIFINPIQFNKKEDLDNYPRTLDADIQKLEKENCDVLFLPNVSEMYPTNKLNTYNFGAIATVMEGAFRPGHFDGVANVIQRFFEIIKPTYAFFGEKDFQQLAVVKELTKQLNLSVKIVGCPIYREPGGLAMSSRNERLSPIERTQASIIYKTLQKIKNEYSAYTSQQAKEKFNSAMRQAGFVPEYIEFADGNTLQPIENWNETSNCFAFVAVNVGNVRLIDNLSIF